MGKNNRYRKDIAGIIVLIMLIFMGCSSSGNQDKPKREISDVSPNIVFIISDDQSWTDYGFMGHPHIETPNIDKLASESLTFTRGYLTAPVCRPSLASIITGLYPHQHGITGNDPAFSFEGRKYSQPWMKKRAELNEVLIQNFRTHSSITDLLKKKGYISLQTGKWWEGSWKDGGFTDGMTHGDPERDGRHGDAGLDIGREGMEPIEDFLDESEKQNKPFFLWYAPFLPHTPHTPPDSLLAKYSDKTPSEPVAKYWAMVEWFDRTVGQLLAAIDGRGFEEHTIVVYVSDNGWAQNPESSGFLWPSKQSPYDAGIRTPLMYKWPGHIAPKMDTTTFVSSIDIVPAVLQAAGLEPTSDMQGMSVLNHEELKTRSAVFSEDYNHDIADVHNPTKSLEHRMIMSRPWKLIVPRVEGRSQTLNSGGGGNYISMIKEPELYHIVNDPHEKNNVASEYPEVVRKLRQQLNAWWKPDF